jgi:hypothetical protein
VDLDRLNSGIVGSNPAQGMDVCLRCFGVVLSCLDSHCVGLVNRSMCHGLIYDTTILVFAWRD